MCLAIPSRVVAMADGHATVECFGIRRTVSLMLMTEEVAEGDYLLIQAGSFAAEKVPSELAEEALRLLAELLPPGEAA